MSKPKEKKQKNISLIVLDEKKELEKPLRVTACFTFHLELVNPLSDNQVRDVGGDLGDAILDLLGCGELTKVTASVMEDK